MYDPSFLLISFFVLTTTALETKKQKAASEQEKLAEINEVHWQGPNGELFIVYPYVV